MDKQTGKIEPHIDIICQSHRAHDNIQEKTASRERKRATHRITFMKQQILNYDPSQYQFQEWAYVDVVRQSST